MKRYLLSVYQPEGPPPPAEFLNKVMQEVGVIIDDMKKSGAWVFNGPLHPVSTSTVLRLKGDDVLITDGPYAEGKEHVGGLMILQSPDLDGALAWARRFARAITLPIEVRPFHDPR